MRFNERQMTFLSLNHPDMEDRLNFTVMTTGNSVQFTQKRGFKDRWFRLKYNLLFYFKFLDTGTIDLSEPVGVLVLEGCSVNYETASGTPFAFSLSFPDQPDRKYIFSAKTEEAVHRWIGALRNARYSELRKHARKLQSAVMEKMGQDPLERHLPLNCMISSNDETKDLESPVNKRNGGPEVNLINF